LSPPSPGPTAAKDGTENLQIRLAAVPGTVTALRWMARDFAIDRGADERLGGDVMLAVSEAVTNAVKHAYPGAGEGEVELRATVAEEKRLEVVVSDEGRGFRPGPSEGLGAGLMLIGECADTLAVDQGAGGVTVQMVFQLR
jgi:serine/threonine-protein kinase RsbW